jgi:DNA-binding NtrC family response regulator
MSRKPTPEDVIRSKLLGGLTLREHLQASEKDLIVSILAAVGQSRTRAADVCGLTREGLHKKLRGHGIGPLSKRLVSS